jgi:hypothetical protein
LWSRTLPYLHTRAAISWTAERLPACEAGPCPTFTHGQPFLEQLSDCQLVKQDPALPSRTGSHFLNRWATASLWSRTLPYLHARAAISWTAERLSACEAGPCPTFTHGRVQVAARGPQHATRYFYRYTAVLPGLLVLVSRPANFWDGTSSSESWPGRRAFWKVHLCFFFAEPLRTNTTIIHNFIYVFQSTQQSVKIHKWPIYIEVVYLMHNMFRP